MKIYRVHKRNPDLIYAIIDSIKAIVNEHKDSEVIIENSARMSAQWQSI